MPSPQRNLADFKIERQPDDTTCGPTCLKAVYGYYGDVQGLGSLTATIPKVEGGGTLGVHLAIDALRRGYSVKIHTWNLNIFDPTWFATDADGARLLDRVRARMEARKERKLRSACKAYGEFLELGGNVALADLEPSLLRRLLRRGVPILTGLSATFLYREPREHDDGKEDDIAGDPTGHFVVLTGYRKLEREVVVSDPLYPNPLASGHTYSVPMSRLIGAIYLGVLTYDANLVVIEPGKRADDPSSPQQEEARRENDRRRQ